MSKEMDNQSFNERHSLTSGSGILGLASLRPKMQPIRVKALLEMYGSDEDESEEKGRESDGESDCDDIQPLPDDDEEAGEVQKLRIKESSGKEEDYADRAEAEVADRKFQEQRERRADSPPKHEKIPAKFQEQRERRADSPPKHEKIPAKFQEQRESSRRADSPPKHEKIPAKFQEQRESSRRAESPPKHEKIPAKFQEQRESSRRAESPPKHEKIPAKFQEQRESSRRADSPPKHEKIPAKDHGYADDVLRRSSTFTSEEHSHVDFKLRRTASLSLENAATSSYSAAKHSNERNHGSNINFKPHESLYPSGKSYAVPKYESNAQLPSALNKCETASTVFPSNERHSHSSNSSSAHPEPPAAIAPIQAQTSNHHITDTPHKHNPPVGSMRPTPSISHRSMFQTPLSEKLHPQDYSKNHVQTPRSEKLHHQDFSKNHGQTPATIFGNWSQRHMAQTPMQCRLASIPAESSRAPAPPSIHVSQHPAAVAPGIAGSIHETPWYRGTEEKKVRRPLGETMQSSTNHQRLSQSEKAPAHYSAESSNAKHHENPDNPAVHGVLESVKEISANKNTPQYHGIHETKENRQPPPPLIDKLAAKEKEQGSRGSSEGIKDSVGLTSNGKSTNDNRQEAPPRHRSDSGETPAPWSSRSHCTPAPKSSTHEAIGETNAAASNQKANVQLSIPSSIRKVTRGETMVVKGKEYLILGTIGQGMSCYVLRVQDLTSLELRAIKVVNLSRMDKDSAQGCMQEISMLHKLQAPCVVRMFDYEIKYPTVHVVLEMGDTDFRSLLNSMSEKKRLPLTMILYYWTEMLTAVKHIHENGVIHSDLKPANFLLVRGRLKLIDFGIASSINADMTSVVKNSTIGTLNYISPEALMDIGGGGSGSDSPNQNVKYKITFKSDVWSLGCILYSLIYGYTPFNSIRSQWAKIQAITNPNPKISYALPPGNDVDPPPPILIEVLRKCLQHDPKARPTVTQLLQIPYITTKPNSRAVIPDLPSNIVMKIRHSLTDDEWRQFTEIMEARRNNHH